MKIHLILQLLILFLQALKSHSNSCSTYLITETPKTYNCDAPIIFPTPNVPLNSIFNHFQQHSSSFSSVPSPYKILALSLTIKPTGICAGVSEYLLLTASIAQPNTNNRRRVMIIKYILASNTIALLTEDSSAEQTIHSTALSATFTDKPVTIYMSIDLTAGNYAARGAILAENKWTTTSVSPVVSYGFDWAFDPSSTRISVCSNSDGTPGIGCVVQNLKLMYTIPQQVTTMPFSNINLLVGDYKLDEKQGTSLENFKTGSGALGPGFLVSSAFPKWTFGEGLEFSENANGQVQIPNFIPSGQDVSITTSVAFVFYLKINKAPATNANILSYYCQSITNELINLQIAPTLKFNFALNGLIMTPPQAITLGQWTTIYLAFALTSGGYGRGQLTIDGTMATSIPTSNSIPASLTFSALDSLTIGGTFSGHIKRIQIYSPGSLGVVSISDMCNPGTCGMEIGFSNPPDCLQRTCTTAGLYASLGTCEPCPSTCQTCTDPSNCQSCSPGSYSVGTSCVECPKGKYVASPTTCFDCPPACSACIDAQTCTSCHPGFAFSQNTCFSCPAGTYLTSDQICKELPKSLQDTLTNSQLINSGATQIANLISKGSSISLSAAVSGRIFSQIKYLNISYSGELQVALLTWLPSFVSLGLTPNMPEFMEEVIPERHVPYVFEKYEVPSSFLINFWENLGVIAFFAILWGFLKGLELIVGSRKNFRAASLTRKGRVLIQNFLITALFGVYGDLVMFAIVEYRTFKFGWNFSLLSWITSVILLIVMFISFFAQVRLLLNYQNLKKQDQRASNSDTKRLDKFREIHEGSQVLFKDLKDYSLSPQLFLFFLSGRDLIFSLLLATMFEYPLAQTLIITILDCLMIAYLFIKKPFDSVFDFAQQLFFEFIALLVNVTVFVNAIFDTGKYEAIGGRNNIGKLIIIANIIFNFITAVFMLIAILQILIGFYKGWKTKRTKKLRDLRLQTQVQKLPTVPQSKSQFNQDSSFFELQSLNQGRMTSNNSELVSLGQESFDLNLLPQEIRPSMHPKRIQRPLPKQDYNSSRNLQQHQRVLVPDSRTLPKRGVQRANELTMKPLSYQNNIKEA